MSFAGREILGTTTIRDIPVPSGTNVVQTETANGISTNRPLFDDGRFSRFLGSFSPHGRFRLTSPVTVALEAPVMNGNTSPSVPTQERYPEYGQHPAEVIFMGSVVLPRLAEVTERNLHGKTKQEKQEYLAGLVDTYHVVVANPDSLIEQTHAVSQIGLPGHQDYLGQVNEIMPDLQSEREIINSEAVERTYRANKRLARRVTRRVKHQIGKDEVVFLPESPGLPLEMVTNLAVLDTMIGIFTQDAYDRNPNELKKRNGKNRKLVNPRTRAQNKKLISDHVTGLLTAFTASESLDIRELPDFDAFYMDRLSQLRPLIEEQRAKLESESTNWTPAQQRRHVLKAIRHFNSYDNTLSLQEKTGLTQNMKKDIKKDRWIEYGKSGLWMGTIEGSQIGTSWLLGAETAHFFDLKNLATVGILAGVARATTTGLLVEKGRLSGKVAEKTGVAPDPVTKWTHERFGKPQLGFWLSHGPFEVGYAASTISAMKVLGGIPGLASEITADVLAIPRQITELIGMQMVIQDVKGSKAKWAWNAAAKRLGLPQITDIKNIPSPDLHESEMAPTPIADVRDITSANRNSHGATSEINIAERVTVAVPVGEGAEVTTIYNGTSDRQIGNGQVVGAADFPHAS